MTPSTLSKPKAKTKPKYQVKYLIGAGVILAVIIGLIAFGLSQTGQWADNLAQFSAKGSGAVGQGARVTGQLKANSVVKNVEANKIAFVLTDGVNDLPVSYSGVVPDTFDHAIEVVVEGKLDNGGTFAATNVLARCPSKYDEANNQPSDYQWYNGGNLSSVQGPQGQ